MGEEVGPQLRAHAPCVGSQDEVHPFEPCAHHSHLMPLGLEGLDLVPTGELAGDGNDGGLTCTSDGKAPFPLKDRGQGLK